MSALPPTRNSPRSGRPSRRAGARVAAPTASSRLAPAEIRFRIARSMARTLPASVPSASRASSPRTCTSRSPRRAGAVAEPGGLDGIGDQDQAAAGGGEEELDGLAREVDAIDDGGDEDVRSGEGDTGDAGVAGSPPSHRVEDVGDGPSAPVEGGGRRVSVGVRVSERDHQSAGDEMAHQRQAALDLGCDGDVADRTEFAEGSRRPRGWPRAGDADRGPRGGGGRGRDPRDGPAAPGPRASDPAWPAWRSPCRRTRWAS